MGIAVDNNHFGAVHYSGGVASEWSIRVHRGSLSIDTGVLVSTDFDAFQDVINAIDNDDRTNFEDALAGAFGSPWTSLPNAQRLTFWNDWKAHRAAY